MLLWKTYYFGRHILDVFSNAILYTPFSIIIKNDSRVEMDFISLYELSRQARDMIIDFDRCKKKNKLNFILARITR